MALLNPKWLPNAAMKRIICHWTGGGWRASDLDRMHYHLLIEADGKLVQGHHTIDDNVYTSDGDYAAHTLNANTGAIGVALCGMAQAVERPFDPGPCPINEGQWAVLVQVLAELARRYGIPVTPQTVLGHGEVQTNLGIAQKGKWDPMVLPWAPDMSKSAVGAALRGAVAAALAADAEPEAAGTVPVKLGTKELAGTASNGDVLLRIADLLDGTDDGLIDADERVVVLRKDGRLLYLPFTLTGGGEIDPDQPDDARLAKLRTGGLVDADALAQALDARSSYDATTKAIVISAVRPEKEGARPYTIRPGDTLGAIAARLLGAAGRWREIRKADGSAFSDAEARQLAIGAVVIVPPAVAGDAETGGGGGAVPAGSPPVTDTPDRTDELVDCVPSSIRAHARASIPVILAVCRSAGVTDAAAIAYILATSEHESLAGRFMRELWGPTATQKGYEGRKDLDNTQTGDGFRFRGRGYVQITGRANYRTWSKHLDRDLVGDPDIVAREPEVAARILVEGMRDGQFRPSAGKLAGYVSATPPDFYNARSLINGDRTVVDRGHSKDRGTRIADIARRYLLAFG